MFIKKIKLVLFFCLIMVSSGAYAQIRLPAIVSSHMVLQRNTEINLWGWSKPKEQITIEISWNGEKVVTKADQSGKWKVKVNTNDKRGPQKVIISTNSDKVVLDDILLGEVWLCAGQSNMEQHVRGFTGQPTLGSTEALLNSNDPEIRLFTVMYHGAKVPLDSPKIYYPWVEASPETVENFGAVAYFFGKKLKDFLDVPVGLIYSAFGGSKVQAWMSTEAMEEFEEIDLTEVDIEGRNSKNVPTAIFNAMINPLIPYTLKGTLWYQGESNRMDPGGYTKLFPAMVKDWRAKWGQGEFPFYFVQIAPFRYGNNKFFQDTKNSAFQREAQLKCVDLIPNSGIAVTLDIGDEKFIHPPKKKEVADRLLLLALDKTYGVKGLESESPVYSSMETQESGLLLTFANNESGLYALGGELKDFEIAGADHIFYPAEATIVKRKELLVKSPKVPDPVAVRYAWKNWVQGTLFTGRMLPVSSFRTDDWEEATRANDN